MGYQTLYLKYRSQTFADLVGQEAIARTLQNAVQQDRVAHAYLFCGVRGTGKTSTARILAKAVNCLDRRGAEPCGACVACREIGSGAALDLIEIDAASNRGIDEIRDLREKVKYLPATLRVKVYIIDEAHMLTPEAFNALLKTLEEPPAHAVFVLATTEPHKIPPTVASRCQRFDFRRIETPAIEARIARIAQAEGARVDGPTVGLLARLAQGSMRDAITILDQLLSQGAKDVTVERTRELLGLADPDSLLDLLAAATGGDAAGVLARLQAFYDAGGDIRQLVRGLLQTIRQAALLSVGYREADAMGESARERLEATARAAGPVVLLDLWKGLMDMEPELRKGADGRLLLEVTLLRTMNALPTSAQPTSAQPAAAASVPAAFASALAASVPAPAPAASVPAPAPAASVSALASALAEGKSKPAETPPRPPAASGPDPRWDALKQRLPRPVSSLLQEARLVARSDRSIRIEFRYPAHLEQMQRVEKKEMLAQAIREVFGDEVMLELAALEKPAELASAGVAKPVASPADDPVVKEAMNRFDVISVRVRPNRPTKPAPPDGPRADSPATEPASSGELPGTSE